MVDKDDHLDDWIGGGKGGPKGGEEEEDRDDECRRSYTLKRIEFG